jgi:hypothetical protein
MATNDVAEKTKPESVKVGSGTIRLPADEPKLEEYCRRRRQITCPPGTTKEDPLYPAFWGEVTKWLTRHDIITLLARKSRSARFTDARPSTSSARRSPMSIGRNTGLAKPSASSASLMGM